MQGCPDLHLVHSNSLDVLAAALARELRAPAPGQPLLAPDVVLIPQAAMRRWLQARLAQAHGIAANLRFLTPGEFVQQALDANIEGAGEDLDAATLRWRILAALQDPALLRQPALRAWREYLAADDPTRAWGLAGELAAVFEKYQAWRGDWLLAWDAGADPGDPQALLWRAVAGARRHRAWRIDAYLRAHAGGDTPPPDGLPARVSAFATVNVSPDVLRVIGTVARAGALHLYLPTPSRRYWGDLPGRRERPPVDGAQGPDAGEPGENRLLQAWGAAGRDFMAVLGSYEALHPTRESELFADPEQDPEDEPERDTLLGRLQRDLLHRRAPPAAPWRAQVDRDDPSLQLHACHTPLREVQVLHDRLQALLADPRFDPPLQPRDIAVLAPDIDPYLPAVQAVFGGLRGQPGFIPYAVADASALASEPLAEVFARLLALPLSRFGLHEVLDLLASPAIAAQAGLQAEDFDRLRHWLGEAGARWGLDAAHRARHDAPAEAGCTWQFALDRLLLGHASGGDLAVAGVVPWPDLEGGALDALDTLLRLLRVLARHERALAQALPPAQWRERLLGLLDALLPRSPRDPGDARALERLRALVDGFAADAARAGFDAPVSAEVVRVHLQGLLGEADTRAPLLSGGVSFARMVPMRLLPFRVLCVLGMNDGEYPRRDPAAGLSKLVQARQAGLARPGDRSLREDDRFLFLQLFAAAGEVFYLSWQGADPRDGSVREPSPLVAELLDTAGAYHAAPAQAREALVLRHPLQPFSPLAFGGDGADPRHFSFRAQWQPASRVIGAGAPQAPFVAAPLPLPSRDGPETLALVALRRFLSDPPDGFLRGRLGMRLPEPVDAQEDVEPLLLPTGGLDRYRLQQHALPLAAGVDAAALAADLQARGWLPPGAAGLGDAARLHAELAPYAHALARWRGDAQAVVRDVDLDLGSWRLQCALPGVYAHGLLRVRVGELHGPSQLAQGLDWLALCAAGEAVPLVQLAVHEGFVGVRERAPVPPAQARAALECLLALRDEGLAAPLPFLPRTGWAWYTAAQGDTGNRRGRARTPWSVAREQWRNDRGFSEGDTAAARLALRGADPFEAEDSAAAASFARVARRVFDAVLHARVAEAGA